MGFFSNGAGKAAAAQTRAAENAMAVQTQQFNYLKDLISPYEQGGREAFSSQLDLLGLGDGSQQDAINNLTNQDYFKTLVAQGEDALLQNASATGGLRGGNTQSALAQFRPSMIQQLVQQQLSNLGGITNVGLGGVNALSGASQNFSNQMGQQYQNIGNAQANAALSKGSTFGNLLGTGLQIAGVAGGLGWAPFASKAVGGLTGGFSGGSGGVSAFLQ